MEDKKKYYRLNDGTYAVSLEDWEADEEKIAKGFDNGTGLKIFEEGNYTDGCDYAFAMNEHWYMY